MEAKISIVLRTIAEATFSTAPRTIAAVLAMFFIILAGATLTDDIIAAVPADAGRMERAGPLLFIIGNWVVAIWAGYKVGGWKAPSLRWPWRSGKTVPEAQR